MIKKQSNICYFNSVRLRIEKQFVKCQINLKRFNTVSLSCRDLDSRLICSGKQFKQKITREKKCSPIIFTSVEHILFKEQRLGNILNTLFEKSSVLKIGYTCTKFYYWVFKIVLEILNFFPSIMLVEN